MAESKEEPRGISQEEAPEEPTGEAQSGEQQTQSGEQPAQTGQQADAAQQLQELQSRLQSLESEKAQLQRVISKHQGQDQAYSTILNRLDENDEAIATVLDMMQPVLDSLGVQQQQQQPEQRKSHRQKLEERRQERQKQQQGNQQQGQDDPNVQMFFEYVKASGLDPKGPEVLEAVQGRNPQEALAYLVQKRGGNRPQQGNQSQAQQGQKQETEDQRIERKVQERLKQMGLAGSEGGPSGSSQPSLEELGGMSMEQYAAWAEKQGHTK